MTIEERAHQYGCKAAGGWYKGGMRGSVYEAHHDAYIEIATEQRNIDIENFVKWGENFNENTEKSGGGTKIDVDSLREFVTRIILGDEHIHNMVHFPNTDSIINEYEKAMEDNV